MRDYACIARVKPWTCCWEGDMRAHMGFHEHLPKPPLLQSPGENLVPTKKTYVRCQPGALARERECGMLLRLGMTERSTQEADKR